MTKTLFKQKAVLVMGGSFSSLRIVLEMCLFTRQSTSYLKEYKEKESEGCMVCPLLANEKALFLPCLAETGTFCDFLQLY